MKKRCSEPCNEKDVTEVSEQESATTLPPFYTELLFQQHKRRRSTSGDSEANLQETGSIHIYKRQVVKLSKIEDTEADRKALKRQQNKELSRVKAIKLKELNSELDELKTHDALNKFYSHEAFQQSLKQIRQPYQIDEERPVKS